MTALDDRLVPRIAALITRVGISATYVQDESFGFDPGTGDTELEDGGGTNTYTVTVTPPASLSLNYIPSATAVDGDTVVYIAGQGLEFTPRQTDRITINSEEWVVTGVTRYVSGASIPAYELIVQGGTS